MALAAVGVGITILASPAQPSIQLILLVVAVFIFFSIRDLRAMSGGKRAKPLLPRFFRRPLRRVITLMFKHHPYGTRAHFR